MSEVFYRGRRAVQIENRSVRLTVTAEGGHVAEIVHKPTGLNPLWTPPWATIEPSAYNRGRHPEYGSDDEAQLLSGILGHNICLDTFGAPSPEEAAAGMPVHGEAAVVPYELAAGSDWITMEAVLPKAELRFKRRLSLQTDSSVIEFSEELENLSHSDRPIAWTQHVTLGPPFLKPGLTQFRVSATRSKVIDSDFNEGRGAQQPGAEFSWPLCPTTDGGTVDLQVFPDAKPSGGFSAHLMNPEEKHAWFLAWEPETSVLFGYVWGRADFPWLARWEENHLRTQPPWNSNGVACGMEFGVSPMVESRRDMVKRASLFGVPTFRWLSAKSRAAVRYCAFVTTSQNIPDSVTWDEAGAITFNPRGSSKAVEDSQGTYFEIPSVPTSSVSLEALSSPICDKR